MEVFFYGLFMDVDILSQKGINPTNLRKGRLADYALKIGNRASLIPCKNEMSYGVLMTVEEVAIQRLYDEASVSDYIPEEVQVMTNSNESIKAMCYNLPAESLTGTNAVYAHALFKLTRKLGFPAEYTQKIRKMAL